MDLSWPVAIPIFTVSIVACFFVLIQLGNLLFVTLSGWCVLRQYSIGESGDEVFSERFGCLVGWTKSPGFSIAALLEVSESTCRLRIDTSDMAIGHLFRPVTLSRRELEVRRKRAESSSWFGKGPEQAQVVLLQRPSLCMQMAWSDAVNLLKPARRGKS